MVPLQVSPAESFSVGSPATLLVGRRKETLLGLKTQDVSWSENRRRLGIKGWVRELDRRGLSTPNNPSPLMGTLMKAA